MRWAKIIAVVLIVLVGGYFALDPILNNINLGLDLQGGVHVVLLAEKPEGGKITDKDMQQLKAVMQERVDELGVAEPVIQIEGDRRLIIELPGVKDPEKAVDIIGRTAYLEFKTHDGQTILTGSDLSDAQGVIDPTTNEPIIDLQFNERGTKIFAETTSELVEKYREGDPRRVIGIYLDGKMLTSPFVKDVISNGRAQISGGFADYEEAANLAALLRAGALPVNVKIIEKRTVGPVLGQDSLEKSKKAVFWGIVLVMIYMVSFYRVPGLVADFALLVYALLVLAVLAALNATLTLPGIAGFLLSVGMAVDANVIIYERIKEEIRSGKSLRASVEAGFRRAILTVMDANITTLLAAAVLFKFGTGPVRGFAVTLSIGVLASLFTAIVLTRYILRELTSKGLINNPKLFGLGLQGR
ncbi:MAG: protein translocase subunit SecD [Clostridia bacterium]|nr:protein translocase subunit SecD [Clostridia bacterium]